MTKTDFIDRLTLWASVLWVVLAIIAVVFLLSACDTVPATAYHKSGVARVTLYNPHEIDYIRIKHHWKRVCFGRHTASGAKAIEGVTVAAPSWVPIGTRVNIPKLKGLVGNGHFVVQDRGKLDRDGGRFDVFVMNTRKMHWLAGVLPEWMEVELQ